VGAATLALTAFEVTIRCTCAALSWLQNVRVHPKTHRATWFTPLKSSIYENGMQPFCLGLLLYKAGAWDNKRAWNGDFVTLDDASRCTEIFDTAICARANPHGVNLDGT
jgi:hypothetical protein